ncbi:MAG TPA: L-histidine N(alpha)-methyltransferase [Longimicrobiales bacterium]
MRSRVAGRTGSAVPAIDRMRAEVAAGLMRKQKELPAKYFYDERGSRLFEEITRLPEYYPTRVERALLEARMPELVETLRPRTLIELGAGSAEKSRIILDAMRDAGTAALYVPIDVSAEFLVETAAALRAEYPGVRVMPLVADITADFTVTEVRPGPTLFAFLGSTIGNFDEAGATALLRRVRAAMRTGDRLLLGADLDKDPAVLEAAYNDASGVTAEFNRNALRVVNRELGADFDPDAFTHRAIYDRDSRRIEMHLISKRAQTVTIPDVGAFHFREGESIRTEISCKYDRERVDALLATAGLRVAEWWTDRDHRFALALGAPA